MRWSAALAFALSALSAGGANAHDSWIVHDAAVLSLATGNRYPRAELAPPADSIALAACVNGGGRPLPFRAGTEARACWAELREFEIDLEPRLVDVYLKEARPPDAVRARWLELHADGTGWHERYRKFARIELGAAGASPDVLRAIRRPAGLDLEIVPVGDAPLKANAPARFAVLSRGEPVRGQAVELVSERSPVGVWSRTNSQGELQWTLPFAGRWLVRAIAIEPDGPSAWRSRFATLAFEAN